MAKTKYLARDLTMEVLDENESADYVHIGGLNTLTHSPSTNRADTTDFDDNGHETHIPAARGESWALAGFAIEDVTTGLRDAGQRRCEVLSRLIGLGGLGTFKITSPGGNTCTFEGSVEVTQPGGGNNDAAAWAATVTISGEPEYAGPEELSS